MKRPLNRVDTVVCLPQNKKHRAQQPTGKLESKSAFSHNILLKHPNLQECNHPVTFKIDEPKLMKQIEPTAKSILSNPTSRIIPPRTKMALCQLKTVPSSLRPVPQMLQENIQRQKTCRTSSSPNAVETSKVAKASMSPAELVRQLLAKNSNLSCEDSKHDSFFTKPTEEELVAYTQDVVCAVRRRDMAMLRTFLASGRRLHCSNRYGESLLHMACRRGYNDVAKFLLEDAGVPARIKDDFGRTPMHDACWAPQPNYDLIEILFGKDPGLALVADVRGHTPFDYVRKDHWSGWNEFLRGFLSC